MRGGFPHPCLHRWLPPAALCSRHRRSLYFRTLLGPLCKGCWCATQQPLTRSVISCSERGSQRGGVPRPHSFPGSRPLHSLLAVLFGRQLGV